MKLFNITLRQRKLETVCRSLLRKNISATASSVNLLQKQSNNVQPYRLQQARFLSSSSSPSRLSEPLQWSYLSVPGEKGLLGMTVGQSIERAEQLFGDREAVVSMHQNLRKTFHDLNRDASAMAAGLIASGLVPGDRLGIWIPNKYEYVVTQFAAAKAGLVLVNINPAYRPNELLYCLRKVCVKAIVCADKFKTSDYYELLSVIAPELSSSEPGKLKSKDLPDLKTVIFISPNDMKGCYNYNEIPELASDVHKKKVVDLSSQIEFDSPCNIQFTSGTTGSPKGAVLSHHNLVNNGDLLGKRMLYDQKEHRICVPVPLYHCFGCVGGIQAGVMHGATCVLPSEGFSGAAAVDALLNERITSCYGTPTMFVDIISSFKKKGGQLPDSLSTGVMAGAPCPAELVQSVIEDLNMKDFVVLYGMTETSPVTFQCFTDDSAMIRSTTIGFPSCHTEVKVVDEEGKIVPTGVDGELYIRGYCVFLGYWDDEEKTKEVIGADRWFKTGDTASLDSFGYAQIKGRRKDMIIRGGENIYPAEVENFFLTHPDIKEAQVFGVPDQRMGEEVVVWLKLKDSTLTEDEVKDWCNDKISHFKVPRYVLFKDTFPTTVTGKVQKFVMQDITIKELGLE